jgi:hypothetical protein
VLLLLTALILSSCAARSADLSAAGGETMSYAVEAPAAMAPAPAMEKSADYSGAGAANVSDVNRLVIKNANLSIITLDPVDSLEQISRMADKMGGWVVTSNLYKSTNAAGVETPAASVTIRVPADQLTAAMDFIRGLVEDPETDVVSENVSGQDVTSEYTDLTSRKTNLELAEAQLQKILESATETEDVLNVFNQLTQVRGEIEVIKGQMKYYKESAAFSSIYVDIVSKESIEPITVGGWHPQGIARDAVQGLLNTLKVLVNILIYFVILVLPVLAILYGVVRLFIWIFKLIFKRKPKVPQAPKA